MSRFPDFVPNGVIPAVLLPFHDDLSIDDTSFRRHLRDVAAVEGLSAVTINAHSTEVASCTFEEQRRVLEITQDEIGDKLPIVHGVWADGSLEAARIARMARRAAPRRCWFFRRRRSPWASRAEMAIAHFRASPTPATCRSSSSSIRSRPARAIRATRS